MRTEVWAPNATDVRIHFGPPESRSVVPLTRAESEDRPGWWSGPDLEPGCDYAFEVDHLGPFPDPRSAWQPHGVHDFSRVFDAKAFEWTDDAWMGRDALGALFYEVHVGTFTEEGTFDAIHDPARTTLVDLLAAGVEMIELMPIAPFPGRYGWGYDGVSLYAVHEPYGGPIGLQRLVDALHTAGIGVCLDVVYNHLGPSGNYTAQFGPYFTDAHTSPWGDTINLDQEGSGEVRRYLVDHALRLYEDFHVDALRLDAVHELYDSSSRPFLAELSDAVASLSRRLKRPLSLIAESDQNDIRLVTPTAEGGLGMTAQWSDDVHHALHTYLTGERHGYYVDFGSIECLDKVYRNAFWHDGTYSTFRGKKWGRPVPATLDRHRFVVCAANHDQVGNRALGDRPSATLSPGAQAASLAFVLLSPFTPLLFMGEESGETRPFPFFSSHDDPDLEVAVREGRIREFASHGWEELYGRRISIPDPQDPATARSAILSRQKERSATRDALSRWYGEVRSLRALTLEPGAWTHYPVAVTEIAHRVLTLHGPVIVHANLSDQSAEFSTAPILAVFGEVSVTDGGLLLEPDSVVLVAPSALNAEKARVRALQG